MKIENQSTVPNRIPKIVWALLFAGSLLATGPGQAAEVKILNVSYDVTREFYSEFNQAFATVWKSKTGDTIRIAQSHGGSSKQAQSVINGLDADVVTMNQPLDVLLTFESEAAQVRKNFPDDALELVVPPTSILAENPVTWVDRNVERHHTEAVARAYLEFLYSEAGQELAAKYYFRPKNQAILAQHADRFKPLDLFTVNEIAGGWQQAEQVHFADGGIFDQIYQNKQ